MFSVHSMGLGINVAHLRKAKGWTLDDLEERSDVGRSVIHAIEKRKSKTSVHAPKLAAALGVSLEDLLSELEPVVAAAPKAAPAVTEPELHQAIDDLRDLANLDPDTRERLLTELHNAADRARAIARRARSAIEAKTATAALSRQGGGGRRSKLTLSLGDGNPRQAMLPLLSCPDPFVAEPSERELDLYDRIAKHGRDR